MCCEFILLVIPQHDFPYYLNHRYILIKKDLVAEREIKIHSKFYEFYLQTKQHIKQIIFWLEHPKFLLSTYCQHKNFINSCTVWRSMLQTSDYCVTYITCSFCRHRFKCSRKKKKKITVFFHIQFLAKFILCTVVYELFKKRS